MKVSVICLRTFAQREFPLVITNLSIIARNRCVGDHRIDATREIVLRKITDPKHSIRMITNGPQHPWYLYQMAAQNTVRTYGVHQVFAEVIWSHRKSRQVRFIFAKDLFYFIRSQHVLAYLIKVPWQHLIRFIINLTTS